MTDYHMLIARAKSLMDGTDWEITNYANISALLYEELKDINWAGFYLLRDNELKLGPFQGKTACTRIPVGKGVCGTAWERGETVVVPDVNAFPGHIACSSESRSEIVVPVKRSGEVVAVLDIDSRELATFDEVDRHWLEEAVMML